MNVAVVSQYYPPEPGGPSNRLGSLVEGLVSRGHRVSVICEQPNHPSGVFQPGYGRRPVAHERRGDATVYRLWVAASPRKTTVRRLAFYGSFASGVVPALLALRRPDVVFASSPPLTAAFAAGVAARLRRTPLVADVRDLWPAAVEALGELTNPRVIRVLERAERRLYGWSSAVTVATGPFVDHVNAVAGRSVAVHLPNGALDSLVELADPGRPDEGPLVVGYAGNLGIAQGLGIVLDAADRLRSAQVRFKLVGDGPLADELRRERDRRGLRATVDIGAGVPTADIGRWLQACDALLVPLRAHRLLESFIPSKLYDAMAVGRPAIVAARGEPAAIVREHACGLVVPPEDGKALAEAVGVLESNRSRAREMGLAGRRAAHLYARSRQVVKLESVLSAVAKSGIPR